MALAERIVVFHAAEAVVVEFADPALRQSRQLAAAVRVGGVTAPQRFELGGSMEGCDVFDDEPDPVVIGAAVVDVPSFDEGVAPPAVPVGAEPLYLRLIPSETRYGTSSFACTSEIGSAPQPGQGVL